MDQPSNAVAPALETASNGRRKELLKDRAYTEIKQLIQDGHLIPGTFLSERQLAQRLGMSKTPVRAALEHLDAQGFVLVSPQQGIAVRDLSLREVGDLFELRTAIEPYAVRQIGGRLSDGQAKRLQSNIAAQRAAAAADDSEAGTKLDIDFHLLLSEFFGNPEVARILKSALDKLYRTVLRITIHSPGRLKSSCEEHAQIAGAVIDGDAALAALRMERHLSFGREFQTRAAGPAI